ncbi:hypothetical protein J4Q44_G00205640 [Coregonus suidteri]|uniref:Uncharacterized protein n=1 Tax=Coregonus suidteri TaxID=861788 RepID=A0AAN8LRW8_9TELE
MATCLEEQTVCSCQQPVPSDTDEDISSELSPTDLVAGMLDDLNRLSIDDNFSEALVAMAKQFNVIKGNPSRLVSAIHCFGKSHISPASNSAAALRRAARQPGPMIPCQPTAVARRSTNAGIKWRLTTGRPKGQNSGSEHPYCSNAKRKRPSEIRHHKLSDSVYANSSHPK